MIRKRKELDLDATILDTLILMSEGNPGAAQVLAEISKQKNGLTAILLLDDMNIRGTQIWVGFKDYCREDTLKFMNCIFSKDAEMVKKINDEGRKGNHPYKAVKEGAYGKREMLEI